MIFRKLLLFPFAIIYGGITAFRNFLYNSGLKKSYAIPNKAIVIGNLSVGGTGKSPHTLYLWELLHNEHPIAILSRGYGRKTKGVLEVSENHTADEVGDEPLMFKKRVGNRALVVVAENREEGVKFIQRQQKNAVILLDDAFQHRKVTAGCSILLTDFNQPYYSDCVLPAGNLRECQSGKKRATSLIVTKCPATISEATKKSIVKRLKFHNNHVFFSQIHYGALLPFEKSVETIKNVLLVTGIANPKPLEAYLKQQFQVESLVFADHHQFTREDIAKIHTKFDTFAPHQSIIVTTEKDRVRLNAVLTAEEQHNYPWYCQTITVKIDKEEMFKNYIKNYVDTI